MAVFNARPCMTLFLFFSSCLILAVVGADDAPLLPPGFQLVSPKGGQRNLVVTCNNNKNKDKNCIATCPKRCPNKCVGLCPSCKTFCLCDIFPGTVCGDPRFTGGDGNNFYFHGKKDADFCILSDSDFHINAHFIGKRNPEKNRDFTWVQALGILFGNNHRLYFGAEKTMTWNSTLDRLVVTFNGEPIAIPTESYAKWIPASVPALSITRTSEVNAIMVELKGVFTIIANAVPITKEDSEIHNYGVTAEDSLAHLDLSFKFHSLSDDVHGVLGQTYRSDYVNKLDVSKKMPIMGGAANFSSSSIFSTDCASTRYHGKPEIAMVTSTRE
ncbi:hypothetical protein LUZ60_013374 [Juncus effusus]|nr:hypothetical protein LUZ60_013374 [Juncus effusus]